MLNTTFLEISKHYGLDVVYDVLLIEIKLFSA